MHNQSKQMTCLMKTHILKCTYLLFFSCFLSFNHSIVAQTLPPLQWQEMAQKGVNFNDIKAAFAKKQGVSPAQLNTAPPVDQNLSPNTEGPRRLNRDLVHFMRWANFYEPRAQESEGDLTVIPKHLLTATAQRAASGEDQAQWKVKGPINTAEGGGNGRVNALRIHPTDDNTLFACTPVGGLWKSINGGASWACISESIAVMGATDVAIDPKNPKNMYLATGDGDAADAFSTGVYKTTDGGNSWSPTGLTYGPRDIEDLTRFGSLTLSRILVDPIDPKILIVGGTVGIFRSENAGDTWVKVSNTPVKDLEFKPNDSKTVYASGKIFLTSIDNGVSFKQNTQSELNGYNIGRISIAVTPAAPNSVYLMACNAQSNGFLGIFTSTNSGVDFNTAATRPNLLGWDTYGSDGSGQGFYTLALAVSPTDSTKIFAGGVNIWQSSNTGANWQCLSYFRRNESSGLAYVHADCHDLIFRGTTLYSANDGGVFKSLNDGKSWTDISSNLAIAQIYRLGLSASNPEMIVSGHQDNGTNLTTDGKNWREVFTADGMECFIDRNNNNNVYSSIYFGNFYKSTDGGANFTQTKDVSGGLWITPWTQDPTNANVQYTAGSQVERFENGSWNDVGYFSYASINQLDVAKSDLMLASDDNSKAIHRFDGSVWKNITNNLPFLPCTALEIDDNNNKNLYVGFASYRGKSLYKSKDNGATWESFSQGLPDVPVNSVLSVKGSPNGDVYAGTDVGVYFRNNLLDTWISFNNGLPGVPVTDMEIYKPLGLLRIATYGRGIWESPLRIDAASVVISAPKNNIELANNATISFSANAIAPKSTVTKVEFYTNGVLTFTDNTAPYSTELSNLANGVVTLTAKGYFANPDTIVTSSEVKITVTNPRVDANLQAILTPSVLTPFSTAKPFIRIKNNGNVPLTKLNIVSQLDNFAAKTLVWSGNLLPLDTVNIGLDTLNFAEGKHKLTVKLLKPNDLVDENTVNDTASLSFEYRQCGEIFEPNNNRENATVIPLNTKIYQPLSSYNDVDVYTFTATTEARAFEVALTNLPSNYNLYVSFDDNATATLYSEGYSNTDRFLKFSALPNQKVFVSVSTYSYSNFLADKCYTLEVKNLPMKFDIGLEKIYRPTDSLITTPTFSPLVRVRNTGNINLDSLIFTYKIDENTVNTYNWTGNLRLNDTAIITLPQIGNYTEGPHQLSISVNTPTSTPDTNLTNNTLSRSFKYQNKECSDSDEPNNNRNIPAYISLNTVVNSILANPQDVDYFAFETTNDAPIINVRLYNLPIDANIALYRYSEYYRGYEYVGASSNYGAQDEVIKYSSSEKGKYVVEISSYYNNIPNYPQNCYSLKVTTSPATRDVQVASIITPSELVAAETFTPRFYLKNKGNVAIEKITLKYKIDNQTEKVYSGSQNIYPSDSVLITLGTFDNYTEGPHSFTVKAELGAGFTDIDLTNNEKTVFFSYKKLCGNNYEPNNDVNTATNVSLDSTYFAQFATSYDVDFYRFSTTNTKPIIDVIVKQDVQEYIYATLYLLNSSGYYSQVSSSYSELSGVRRLRFNTDQAGTYALGLTNSSNSTSVNCYDFKISALPLVRDVALRTIAEPATDTINGPGVTPSVFLSNLGNFAIKSVGFSYRIDEETDKNYTSNTADSWYYSNDTNALFNIKLPAILGYSEGWHTLHVRVTSVNGSADENLNNNYLTKRFYYKSNGCADNFETEGNEFVHNIPINTTVRGMISTFADYDKFSFNTTNAKPVAKVSIIYPNNTGYDIRITDSLGTFFYPYSESTNIPNERVFNIPAEVGRKWFVTVGSQYNYNYTVSDCYALTVQTFAVEPDVAITNLLHPTDVVLADVFIPYLQITNKGNSTVSNITFEYQIDSLPPQTMLWKATAFNYDYKPQSYFTAILNKIKGYTEGVHKLKFRAIAVNGLADKDTTNNTIVGKFSYRNTGCFDNYEPNDSIAKAAIVKADTLIQSFSSDYDVDYFKFYTTADRPNFKLSFKNPNSNYFDVSIVDKNGNYAPNVQRAEDYNTRETLYTLKGSKADTFYLRISNINPSYNDYSKQGCYNFIIKTEGRNDAAQLTAINLPKEQITVSSFSPWVFLKNTGNTNLNTILFDAQIDSLPKQTTFWTLGANDYPDYEGNYKLYLPRMTGYTEGVHTLNIKIREINGYVNQDTQRLLSKKFTYTSSGCDDNYEPNDTEQTAYAVKSDSTYSAMFARQNDQDFYALTTEDPFAYYNVTFKTKNFTMNPTAAINFNNESIILASDYISPNSQATMKVGIKSSQKAILNVQYAYGGSNGVVNDECYTFSIKKLPNSVDAFMSFQYGQPPIILTTDSLVKLSFIASLDFNLKLYNADFIYQVDGGPQKVYSWARPGNVSLYINDIDLLIPNLSAGDHEVKVTLMNPNFGQDPNMSNNTLTFKIKRFNAAEIDAGIIGELNIADTVRGNGVVAPKVILKNFGKSTLEQVRILTTVTFNSYTGIQLAYTWFGKLLPSDTAHVTLDQFGLFVGVNDLKLTIFEPNGLIKDSDTKNDTLRRRILFNYQNTFNRQDIGIAEIVKPKLFEEVTDSTMQPVVMLKNYSDSVIVNPIVRYRLDTSALYTFYSSIVLSPQESKEVKLPNITYSKGLHTLYTKAQLLYSEFDYNSVNDVKTTRFTYLTTSIKDLGIEKCQLSPNPTNGFLQLTWESKNPDAYHFDFMDVTGRVLKTQSIKLSEGSQKVAWQVDDFPQGLYVIKISNSKGAMMLKFMKN
jgi:hypothetical protein